MNPKLIVALSAFGLLMAFATVWMVPSSVEPAFWLVIFLLCAFFIARFAPGKHFLHGLCVSLLNSVWITSVHIAFVGEYLARHGQEAAMMQNMPAPDSPRLMMALTGPVVGVVSGLVLGGLSWLASKVVKPAAAADVTPSR